MNNDELLDKALDAINLLAADVDAGKEKITKNLIYLRDRVDKLLEAMANCI